MQNPRKAALARAAMAAFEPLAGLFAEWAVSSPEAESLLRTVLVHGVRARELLTHGQRVSVSRIALLTGVDRSRVKKILESPPRIDPQREASRQRAARVLAAWHEDPKYQDEQGEPQILPVHAKGRGSASFWSLAKRHAPDVYPALIRDELVRVGAVQMLSGERLKARTRVYGAGRAQSEQLEELGDRVRDLLETLIHNLKATPQERYLCETAIAMDLDPKWLPLVRNTTQKRLRAWMDATRADLNSPRMRRSSNAEPAVRAGVTAYWFEKPLPDSKGARDETPKKARRRRR